MSEKLISRDRISGCWVPNDIEPGEYSGDELRKRVSDQQKQLNKAVIADWKFVGETRTSSFGRTSQAGGGHAGNRPIPQAEDGSAQD